MQTVAITGPFNATSPGDTPSRRRIFVCRPAAASEEATCARKIVTALGRRAYRRALVDDEVETLMSFYQQGRNEGDFEVGIQQALARILVAPNFLYRIEEEPQAVRPGATYRISDLELASRLSFFLWSSIPDDEMLEVAARGRLRDPMVLGQQVKRMLADARSEALTTNFAGQWLYLRELASVQTSAQGFDDNLRQAFRRETEMLFSAIVHEDRSVVDLIDADYTFVDERLARHYGIPNVHGSYFRRVTARSGQSAARAARAGQPADGHVGRHPHVAGVARQVDSRKHPGHAGAGAAARSRNQSREESGRSEGHVAAAAPRGAPRQSGVRVVPQDHGPDRVRAGKLRPGGRLARTGRRGADRFHRSTRGRHRAAAVPPICGRRCCRGPMPSSPRRPSGC